MFSKSIILVFFVQLYCTSAQTTQPTVVSTSAERSLKEELLERAKDLQIRTKAEIVKLQVEKREHLAIFLSNELWKVQVLTNELLNSSPDPIRLSIIESELIEIEYRVNRELSTLERESLTQEMLLSNAQIWAKWIKEEMKKLEVQNNAHAHQAYLELEQVLNRLNVLVSQLTKAQDQITIERIEVELRLIELRISETLKKLGFKPDVSTASPHPNTLSTNTEEDITEYERTGHVRSTTTHMSSTATPIKMKEILILKAKELEKYANTEIEKVKRNGTGLVKDLESLQKDVKEIMGKLEKIAETATNTLKLIESEVYYLEKRLAIESEALMVPEKRVEKLLGISVALKRRIELSIELLGNTTAGKVLQLEAKALESVWNSLKNAKDETTVTNLEKDLIAIDKSVSMEITRHLSQPS